MNTPWSDGTTHLLLSPFELIERLAAPVPPPRLNLIPNHGVLAPNASARKQIVPAALELCTVEAAILYIEHCQEMRGAVPVYPNAGNL